MVAGAEKRQQIIAINNELSTYTKQIEALDRQISAMKEKANGFRYEKDRK